MSFWVLLIYLLPSPFVLLYLLVYLFTFVCVLLHMI